MGDAVDTILQTEDVKKKYMTHASTVARLYRGILPDPRANEFLSVVTLLAVIAARISSRTSG